MSNLINSDCYSIIANYSDDNDSMYSRSNLKVEHIDNTIGPYDIKPDDLVDITMHITRTNSIDMKVITKSMKFKDLCKAIARQLVRNDLDVESS